jgi:hypothetical protein
MEVEGKADREEATTQADSQMKGGAVEPGRGKKRPRRPRQGRRKKEATNNLKVEVTLLRTLPCG